MKLITLFTGVSLTVAVSACNSTSSQYVSGPWGQGVLSHSGPRYSDPWNNGPLVIVQSDEFIDAGGFPQTITNVTPEAYRAEVTLPMDSTPPNGLEPVETPVTSIEVGNSASPDTEIIIPGQAVTAAGTNNPNQVSGLNTAPSGAQIDAPTRTSAFAGSWSLTDKSGQKCRISLSTNSIVDRFRANTQGCKDPQIQSINNWAYDGSKITLYSRDNEIAELYGRPADLTGTLRKDASEVRMLR